MIKTSKEFIDFLNKYDSKNENQQRLLKMLTEKYPYFLAPFLYLLKSNKTINNNEYDAILEKTAVRTFDRTSLYNWLHPENKEEKIEVTNIISKKNIQKPKGVNEVKINYNYREWGEKIQKTIRKINKLQEKKSKSKTQNKKEKKNMAVLLNLIQNELKIIGGKLDAIENIQNKKPHNIIINNNTDNSATKNKSVKPENQVGITDEQSFFADEINEKKRVLEDAQQKAFDIIQNIKQKGFFTKKSLGIKESDSNKEKNNEEEKKENDLEEKIKLIDEFIKKNPKVEQRSSKENLSTDSIIESKFNKEQLMTETLAKLYFEQNKYDDAIKAYKILGIKYPEKKVFFANKIKKIREIKKSTN